MQDLRRSQLIDTAFRGGLAVALYLVFPAFSDIFRLWEREAGLTPGWLPGPFEYPPVAALYFEPFLALPSGRWALAVNGIVMVLAAVAVTWLLSTRSESSNTEDVDVTMWTASPALLLFLPINWDVLVVLISVLGVVGLYQRRSVLSGVWHGVGTAFKLFPGAVVLPAVALLDGWRKRLVFLFSGFVVLAVSYAAYAAIDPAGWRFHLEFASLRTDFNSTIWGVLDRVMGVFGIDLSIGAVNVMSTVSVVAALIVVTIWAARARPTFAQVAAVALIALLVFNKVFKPQYVLWVLPFLAWSRVSRSKVRLTEATAIVQFAVIYFALPTVIFPMEAAARVAVLGLLARDVVKSASAEPATRTS